MYLRKAAHLSLNVLHNWAVTNTKESPFAGTMTSNAAPFGSGCCVIVVAYPFLRISAAKDCGSVTAPRSGILRFRDSILAHSPWRAIRNHCSDAWSGVLASDARKRKNFSERNLVNMGGFRHCGAAVIACTSWCLPPADEQSDCEAWSGFMGPNVELADAARQDSWRGLRGEVAVLSLSPRTYSALRQPWRSELQ